MLDKRKRSVEVDYSDKYVTFQDLMQASSGHVSAIASNRKEKHLDVP